MAEELGKSGARSATHLFLSYATADREHALAIADALEAAGVPVWIDRRGISGGDMWAAQITAAIRSCRALVLVCTPASVTSRNVRQEVQLAWDHDRPILPLLLEPVRFPDEIAYFLHGRQWIEVPPDGSGGWIAQVARFVPHPGADGVAQPPEQSHPEAMVTNLPLPPTAILGRAVQIADVCGVLKKRESQLVSLIGPGGVGKTRLALAVAWHLRESFSGAIHFVDLAPIHDSQLVLPAIAAIVGLREGGQGSLLSRLHAALRDRPLLLVLDNCEQVLDAAGDIGGLMAGLPNLTVLATSREPLRIRAEQTVEVAPLLVENASDTVTVDDIGAIPAVALFVARATAAKPGFALTAENRTAVIEICRRLDGLPLAIELAASRSSLLSPELMLSRLENRLPLLTGGARDLPARQRTLRDAIAWSEDLLTDDERAVLRRLSVFVGGFPLETALAVTDVPGSLSTGGDVLQAMERLVAHSLLRQVATETGEARFQMLETIREFGLERLDSSGESDEAHQRHAAWFLELAERAAPELVGAEQQVWLRRLWLEQDNVRAALAWAIAQDPETALRLSAALQEFWIATSAFNEGALWCERSLAAGADAHPAFVAEAAYTAARLAYRQGNLLPARARAEEALRLFEQLGDDRGIGLAMAALGTLLLAQDYISEDDRATGEELLSAALDRMRSLNDLHHIATIANNLGLAKMYGGDLESALELLRESASMDRAIGDKLTLALKVANTVEVLVKLGRVEEALPILQEVAEVQYQSQHRANVGHLLNSIAFALGAKGEGTPAIRLYAAAELELHLTGSEPFSSELESFRTDIGRLRDELGSAAFETEWTAGRSLSYEAAMEEARVALDAWEAETTSRSGSIGSTGSARRPH